MATSTTHELTIRQQRSDRYLTWVEVMVAEIPLTAEEWPSLPGGERAGFAAEWDNYMGMVDTLIADCLAGDLATDQRDRLHQLAKQIVQLRPLLDGMALHGPDSPDLARLVQAAGMVTPTP